MESLYLLIPISVILVFLIGGIFWWSLKSGQMEDLEGPAYRILMDDDRARTLPKDAALQQPVEAISIDAPQDASKPRKA